MNTNQTFPRSLGVLGLLQTQLFTAGRAGVFDKKGNMKFTCKGSSRGGCGHTHRSLETAQQCCDRDQAAIRAAYPSTFPTRAYSDRVPVALDDEAMEKLDEMRRE